MVSSGSSVITRSHGRRKNTMPRTTKQQKENAKSGESSTAILFLIRQIFTGTKATTVTTTAREKP